MARHDQRTVEVEHGIKKCLACMRYECKKCIDVGRRVVFGPGVIELCRCDHKEQFTGSK